MAYFLIALSLFLLLSALTALRPGRRGMFKLFAFPVGWTAGELAGQAAIVQIALVGVQLWWGWPRTAWIGTTLTVIALLVLCCNAALVAVLFYARVVVRRSLLAHAAPLAVGRPRDDVFGNWWRTALQIPFHPRSLHITTGIPYGPHKRQRLDVWRLSTTPANAPVIFYVHGGAWVFGDKTEQGRPMLHEFVSRGWMAVTPNYRLAPKYQWPAQIEDVTRALGWVKGSIRAMGGDPDRVVVAGASAGGQLAALLALTSDDPTWRPPEMAVIKDWSVRGCISLYGVLEMTGQSEAWSGHGAGLLQLLEGRVVQTPLLGNEEIYRALSPIERITASAPSFLVVQGGNDTLVDVNVARSFVRRFESVAQSPVYYVQLPLTQHAFDVTASPRTSATTRAALAFADSVVSETSASATPGARE